MNFAMSDDFEAAFEDFAELHKGSFLKVLVMEDGAEHPMVIYGNLFTPDRRAKKEPPEGRPRAIILQEKTQRSEYSLYEGEEVGNTLCPRHGGQRRSRQRH
jgi:hypothetical protein